MINKRPLRPDRIRQIPASFSWVDHRLVRENFIGRCGHSALALYLFLLTVADVQGLSYYSDNSLGRYLHMDLTELAAARQELVVAELISHQKPLYQVLSLPGPARPASGSEKRLSEPASVADILRQAMEGGRS
jgi:hypothetical protein